MNQTIFRQYDIRGIVDIDLTPESVRTLGRGIGTMMKREGAGNRLTLGWDARLSSPIFRDALSEGLTSTGMMVIQLGMCTTPAFYYSVHHLQADGGVMITGSHNPPEFNGFKVNIGAESIYGEKIQELYRIIEKGDFAEGEGKISEYEIMPDYIDYLKKALSIERTLRVALDSGNGTAGLVAPEVFKHYNCVVYELFSEPDGNFPNHHPDPTIPEFIETLRRKVLDKGLDFGVAYDGDADRIGVIDDKGNIIWGDELMVIFSRDILKRNPGAAIIAEVKSSQHLFDDVAKNGGRPIMWKTGHSLIEAKMKEEGALLAGEMSGHIFFNDRYFGFDDAVYASLRLAEIVSQDDKPLSEYLSDLPASFSTPEIRFDCPDDKKFEVVKKAQEYFKAKGYDVNDIDGVRLNMGDGWGLLRASNTQPVLVMRFEAQSEERLKEIKSLMENKLKDFLGD
ncbi:MAG: phosphomannomutase/phosphoglucomutase [candidate division Zixibacteria bacterium]|nr:phosphomannomutase/phosphoglucomutase [Candidatus Tariuqbacter arcticus]